MSKAKVTLLATVITVLSVCASRAEKQYDSGATDTSIKIGNTMPYSGPNSAFAIIGRAQAAYFRMVNDQGGINGRKIDYIASGGTVFGDYKQFPWSMGFQTQTQGETRAYGRYLAKNYPNAKIGVLYSSDGLGRDNIEGFKQGLGDKVGNITVEQIYDATAPTIDSQLVKIRTSGVDVFANFTTPKFAAMAIRKSAEMGWKPVHILHAISLSIETVLKPAGLENAKDIITSNYLKEYGDPTWDDDPGMKKFVAFLDKYLSGENKYNSHIAYAYVSAQTLVHILQQCGDDLTRANVMRQAESLRALELDVLLPGIKVNTSQTNHYPIQQTLMHRFDGVRWQGYGPIVELD